MDISLFRSVVFGCKGGDGANNVFKRIAYCSKVAVTDRPVTVFKVPYQVIKRYKEINDLYWMLKHGYEALAWYKISRGEPVVVKRKSITLLCRTHNIDLFKYCYNNHQCLFRKKKILNEVALYGTPAVLDIILNQVYPVKFDAGHLLDTTFNGYNIPIIEYLVDNCKQGVSLYRMNSLRYHFEDQYSIPAYVKSLHIYMDNIVWQIASTTSFLRQDFLVHLDLERVKYIYNQGYYGGRNTQDDLEVLKESLGCIFRTVVTNYHEYTKDFEENQFIAIEWMMERLTGKGFDREWKEEITEKINNLEKLFRNEGQLGKEQELQKQLLLIKWLEYFNVIEIVEVEEIFNSIIYLVKNNQSKALVDYLIELEEREYIDRHIYDLFCKYGTLDQIKHCHSLIMEKIKKNKELESKGEEIFIMEDPAKFEYKYHRYTLTRHDLEITKFFVHNPIGIIPSHYAVKRYHPGMVNVAKYLLSEECKDLPPVYKQHLIPINAMFMGDLELIKLIGEKQFEKRFKLQNITRDMFDSIIQSNQSLEIIQYFHQHQGFSITPAMVSACTIGNLKVVQFLNEVFTDVIQPHDTQSFLDKAFQFCHLNIVDYLIKNRNSRNRDVEGFSKFTINLAIKMGNIHHLEMVYKYSTLSIVKEVETTHGILKAIFKYGKLELLKWFIENGSTSMQEYDIYKNMEYLILSTTKGHQHVIQYCLSKMKETNQNNISSQIDIHKLFVQSLVSQHRPLSEMYYKLIIEDNKTSVLLTKLDLQRIIWICNLGIIDYLNQIGVLGSHRHYLSEPNFYVFKVRRSLQEYLISNGFEKVWLDHQQVKKVYNPNTLWKDTGDENVFWSNRMDKEKKLKLSLQYTFEEKQSIYRKVFSNKYLLMSILQRTRSKFLNMRLLGKSIHSLHPFTYSFTMDCIKRGIYHSEMPTRTISKIYDSGILEKIYGQSSDLLNYINHELFDALHLENITLVRFLASKLCNLEKGIVEFREQFKLFSWESYENYRYQFFFLKLFKANPTIIMLEKMVSNTDSKLIPKYYSWYFRYSNTLPFVQEIDIPQLNELNNTFSKLFISKDEIIKYVPYDNHLIVKMVHETGRMTFEKESTLYFRKMGFNKMSYFYYMVGNPISSVQFQTDLLKFVRFAHHYFPDSKIVCSHMDEVDQTITYCHQNSISNSRLETPGSNISYHLTKYIMTYSNKSLHPFSKSNIASRASYSGFKQFKYLLDNHRENKNEKFDSSIYLKSSKWNIPKLYFYETTNENINLPTPHSNTVGSFQRADIKIYNVKLFCEQLQFEPHKISVYDPITYTYIDSKISEKERTSLCNLSSYSRHFSNDYILAMVKSKHSSGLKRVLRDIVLYQNTTLLKELVSCVPDIFTDESHRKFLVDSVTQESTQWQIDMFQYILSLPQGGNLLNTPRVWKEIGENGDYVRYSILKEYSLEKLSIEERNIMDFKFNILCGAIESNRQEFIQYVLLDRELFTDFNNIINNEEKEWILQFTKNLTSNQLDMIIASINVEKNVVSKQLAELYLWVFPFQDVQIIQIFKSFLNRLDLVKLILPKLRHSMERVYTKSFQLIVENEDLSSILDEVPLPHDVFYYCFQIGMITKENVDVNVKDKIYLKYCKFLK